MGWQDAPLVETPTLPAAPKWAEAPLIEGGTAAQPAVGLSENIQAGLQGSAIGLMVRGKLPDLVMDPVNAAWWERLAAGVSGVAADLPIMIPAGAKGAAAGTAVAGPVGGILAGGAAMFAAPAGIRTSLTEFYKARGGETPIDWFNVVRETAKSMLHEGAVGAATFGAGAVARGGAAALMGASGQAATAVGLGTATMATKGASKVAGTADVAAQIAAMVTMPAALEGRMPEKREFLDAAAVILTLKGAHVALERAGALKTTAQRVMGVYEKTGKTPAEQVQDAMAKPEVAEDLTRPADTPIPTFRDQLTKQEELWSIQDRLMELDRRGAEGERPLTEPEAAEREALRTKVTALEAEGITPSVPRETLPPAPPPGPRFAPDQLTEAAELARTRLEALTEKATREALTDAERAERIGLTNAMGNPEALAKRFGIEPALKVPTAEERDASAQRIYDDVYRQLQEADQARTIAGTEPLGDAHAKAVAMIISREARQYGEALGRMPEDVYRERYLTIRDESAGRGAAPAEGGEPPAMPPEAARAELAPEVDLFGEPIRTGEPPQLAVADMATVEVPLANLRLSKEVPQFKKDANAAGVIVPLGGKFDRTGVGPIQVWERLDGSMEVISGRHRLDLARRSGEETIPAQIHREADGYTARQAATLDAQLNIREEQGSVADYAQYFRDSAITEPTANELGLLARAKGRAGFSIARDSSPDTMAAHRAGLLSDEAALVISQTAPGSERLQALGIAMVNDGKSALFAANTMKAVDLMAAERQAAGAQGDIFGFDDSAMREAASMAKKASSMQRKISEQISAVSGASRRPEIARKLGVDVQDPEGVQKKIAELKQEQYQWDNWPLYPELVAKLRGQELKQANLLEGEEQWYHGTREDIADFTRGGEVYLTDRPTEAAGYALGGHLGGTGQEQPRVYSIAAKRGKTLNIDDLITEEIMNGAGEIEVALEAGIAKAKAEGARYVEYQHPAFEGEAEQNVRISLYPAEDLRITHKPTKDRGGVLFQEEFELKPETPAELRARDAEAAAAAKRKLAQERAGVKGPVPTVDQADLFNTQRTLFQTREPTQTAAQAIKKDADRVMREHGEDKMGRYNSRIDVAVAEELAKEGHPDAGLASLIAYVTDSFMHFSEDVGRNAASTRALEQYVEALKPNKTGPLYRVLGFSSEGLRNEFLNKIERGIGNTLQAERPTMSWTTQDATKQTSPMDNVGRDVASQFGDFSVILKVIPREGEKLEIGRDISRLYSSSQDRPGPPPSGLDILVPASTKFKLVSTEEIGDGSAYAHGKELLVTLQPRERTVGDRVLFQDEKQPWYYSELARSIEASPMKQGTAKAWQDYIKSRIGKGVKPEEIEATGINDWLATQEGKVTKEQVQAFMEQGGVKVTETLLGESHNPYDAFVTKMEEKYGEGYDTQALTPAERAEQGRLWDLTQQRGGMTAGHTTFQDYQLPGSVPGSYRELVLTLPEKRLELPPGYRVEEMPTAGETVQELTAEWNKWLADRRIPKVSADEIPRAAWDRLTEADQRYTHEFQDRWDEAISTDQIEGVPPKYRLVFPDGSKVVMPSSQTIEQANDAATQYLQRVDVMPKRAGFESSHFPGSDYLAHTRVNDRILPDGRKVLFVEEIQSDRAQKGRTEGFTGDKPNLSDHDIVLLIARTIEAKPEYVEQTTDLAKFRDIFARSNEGYQSALEQEMGFNWEVAGDIVKAMDRAGQAINKVPKAPFVTKTDSWTALVLKRLLRYAAEGNYDAIAWTRGEQQVERYTSALRKAVDVIEWKKTPEGVQIVGYKGRNVGARQYRIVDDNGIMPRGTQRHYDTEADARADYEAMSGRTPEEDGVTIVLARRAPASRTKVVDTTEKESALSDAIGKSMADRIRNDPNQTGTIEGENITVSDTGMAGYYDRIVPKVAQEVAKKVGGGKVEEIELKLPAQPEDANILEPKTNPQFDPMDARDREGLAGAEDFSDGKSPLIMNTEMKINGQDAEVMLIVDRQGLSVIGADFEMQGRLPRSSGTTQQDALNWIQSRWQIPGFWSDLKVVEGKVPGEDNKPSAQMAIEITPAMREKIMAGQALFQKPGQERDGQHLGSYEVADRIITLFEHANKSTVIHEVGHHFLENLKYFASQPDAPPRVRAMWDTARREFAIGEDGNISTASHEMNARSFERYLGEGKAPSIGLRAVFEQFKTWMLEIYKNLQNIGVQINPEVRDLFDRMLATDQEIADARALDVPRAYIPEARREAADRIVPPAPEGRKIEPGFEAEKASMEPYADELPPGPGSAPADSHINYAYINSPMDVKLAMQRMAEIDQANIQKQRGGTQGVKSWEEANAEQAKYVNDILGGSEDTLRLLSPRDANAPGPDVKLGILKKLAVGAAKDSARLRDVVLEAGHDATVRQQLEYMGSIERARMIQAEFLGERAGVARALNALKDVTEGTGEIGRMLDAIGYGEAAARELFQAARTPAEEQAYMRAKLDEILQNYRGKTVLDIAKLHKEIGTLKGTFKMAKELEKATTWEMVVEGWKASLLSGPVTHTTNLFGTEGFHFLRPAVDALAATIGMARGASPGMGESDRASMSEAVARLGGMISGIKDGVKVGIATFKLDDPTGKTEAYRTAIPGRAGELIRIPLRLMGAEDAMVTTMYKRGELATLAIRQAFDENMSTSTREFAERVAYLKDHPTPEMEAAAETASTRMTFNAPLGEKGVALQLFVNKWNLQWMIPFIRTPINITKEVARMSPLAPMVGEWRAAIAKGGVERDRAIAEVALGTGIMALTMAMTFEGTISGAGDPDPGKNRGKVGVWQPYSRLIGDTWYEYARIQPLGTLVGMAADVATIWDHMNDEEKDKIPKLLAVAFSNAVTNQTFLQGITNVINAMSEPTRFLPRFANQMAGSMVPNVIGQPTAMADPYVREVHGMIEAIQARIPGMRQMLLPKRDWLGEEIQSKERTGVVMPIREQKVSEDKVRLEAARLNISMAAAPKKTHIGKGTGKLGDVQLTPEERNTFAKVGGEMAHQVLTNVVNAPGYDEMPDLVKRKVFAKVLQASHQVAAVAALPPDKRVAYITSISEKMATALEPEAQ